MIHGAWIWEYNLTNLVEPSFWWEYSNMVIEPGAATPRHFMLSLFGLLNNKLFLRSESEILTDDSVIIVAIPGCTPRKLR